MSSDRGGCTKFRIAHIGDLHFASGWPPLHRMVNKRALGYLHWLRSRRKSFHGIALSRLVADIQEQAYDHIVCSGDLCHLSLPKEWLLARTFLESLGKPDRVSFVPGNHDAYVHGALDGLLKTCGEWTLGEDGRCGQFPYLRRRGPVAIIGLSSAVPNRVSEAFGRLGGHQIAAVERILVALSDEPDPPFRLVLVHHPPYPKGATPRRVLVDAEDFVGMIKRCGAELILHGHNHIAQSAYLIGPRDTRVPVIGTASASSNESNLLQLASYQVFSIERLRNIYQLSFYERAYHEQTVLQIERLTSIYTNDNQ